MSKWDANCRANDGLYDEPYHNSGTIQKTEIPIIFIEGGIGCGKSTLVKNMNTFCRKNNLKYLTIEEPVDVWAQIKDENGVNMIEAFYSDQSKYSFEFQMMAYISRLQKLQDAYEKAKQHHYDFIICERSLQTDKNVFCKMLYDEGKINTYGYQIYNKWFDYFQKNIINIAFVYLQTDFNICHERIHKRQRSGESNISKEYLEQNNKYHDNWLLKEENVLILDGNKDHEENEELLNDYCKQIIEHFTTDKLI